MTVNGNAVEYWEGRRGEIFSRKGGWTMGKGVSNHGYSMLDDLVGSASFFQVLMLNVTGRLPDRRLSTWMENAFICLSYPDPRIWCNQIGALGGDARISPLAAICAGTLASDSRLYGPGTVLNTLRFMTQARIAVDSGKSAEEFIETVARRKGRFLLPGYARPVVAGDERLVAMQAVAEKLGFEDGPHLALAYEIQEYLSKKYGESLNLAGYLSAFWLDQGLDHYQGYIVFSMCVNGGVHACFAESHSEHPGSFLPLRCDDIEYTGVQERTVPQG